MTDCCNHNCNEGRDCPERTRRIQERELLWQCRDQMDYRQIAAHAAAGELEEASDEPLTDPNYMLALTALTGVLAVAFIVGGLAWLAYFVWPVLRASLT